MEKKYPRVGIIGGLGYQSTLMYYAGIHKDLEVDYENYGYPEIVIISLDLRGNQIMMGNGEWSQFEKLISSKLSLLEKHEVGFCCIASNTPHYIFPQVQEKTNIPMISIIEATFQKMKKQGYKKTLLLGTRFTMTMGTFEKNEIEIIVPSEEDQLYVHRKLFDELESGKVVEKTREGFISIIEKAKKEHQVTSVILGCTEIPILLTEKSYCGVECVNTTLIHIDAIVKKCQEMLK